MPITVEDFEAARPQLLSVAHRMLGSVHDAQDAVQTAWLRAAAGHRSERIDNPAGWLTTVTARVCLDELRARRRRGEAPLLADAIPAEQLSADEAVLRTENVSRALLVLLEQLTPPQRVAYVLHDLFAVPFDQIAQVLDGTVPSAKKHASRARQRVRSPAPAEACRQAPDREIVEAFLAAARTGDTREMIRLLAPDSVRDADAALLCPERGRSSPARPPSPPRPCASPTVSERPAGSPSTAPPHTSSHPAATRSPSSASAPTAARSPGSPCGRYGPPTFSRPLDAGSGPRRRRGSSP